MRSLGRSISPGCSGPSELAAAAAQVRPALQLGPPPRARSDRLGQEPTAASASVVVPSSPLAAYPRVPPACPRDTSIAGGPANLGRQVMTLENSGRCRDIALGGVRLPDGLEFGPAASSSTATGIRKTGVELRRKSGGPFGSEPTCTGRSSRTPRTRRSCRTYRLGGPSKTHGRAGFHVL